jgi:hypothetical protein
MGEYENKKNGVNGEQEDTTGGNFPDLDLGSMQGGEDFDPFADAADFQDEIPGEKLSDSEHDNKQQETVKTASADKKRLEANKTDSAGATNPMEAAMNEAENTDAEKAKQGLLEKPPVFEYAGASESIEDTSKSFEDLRIEKSTDFPELEDGKRVSWSVEYGKVTKLITSPKDTTIAGIKEEIERSKEFLEALKKAKDKNPVCKLKPRVTAQSKGNAVSYKGVFTTLEEAEAAGKIISFVPSTDGKVYEIRNTEMGKFITPTVGSEMLSNVRAGFIPALPPIPMNTMVKIVSFFRYYMKNDIENEVLLNVYWDKDFQEFHIDAPEQMVTKASVKSRVNDFYSGDRFIHYMDIHSHNSMKAYFSAVDDNDEKATRLYTVIGNLHHYFPDVRTRISNGGKFWQIDPATVFELIAIPFPEKWKENVHFRSNHSEGCGCA